MKKLLWILLSFGFVSTMCGQQNPYKGEKPLQSVKLMGKPCKNGQEMKKALVLQEQLFDAEGHLVQFTDYEMENIVEFRANSGSKLLFMLPQNLDDYTRRAEYSFDSKGNCISTTNTSRESGKTIARHTFDGQNRKIESNGFSAKEAPRYTTTYAYDEHDNLVTQKSMTPKGILKYELSFAYDAENRKVKETKTGREDRFIYDYTYEYDEAGRQVAILSFGAQGEQVSAQSFVFDEEGNQISQKHIYYFDGNEGYATQTDYTFNKKGQKAKEKYYDRTGKHQSTYLHSYDREGNLNKTLFQDAKGNTWETVEYTYLPDGSPKGKKVFNGKKQLVDVYEYVYTFRN